MDKAWVVEWFDEDKWWPYSDFQPTRNDARWVLETAKAQNKRNKFRIRQWQRIEK